MNGSLLEDGPHDRFDKNGAIARSCLRFAAAGPQLKLALGLKEAQMRQPESLLQFFGAYFHQDWGVESPDWQGVVAMFIHDSSAQDIAAVAAGVEHLARGASSEAELERILLNELGCYYTPRPDLGGPSFHDWLLQVVAELKSSQAQPTLQADGPASGGSAA